MDETIRRMDRESEEAVQSLVGCKVQTVICPDARITIGISLVHVVSVSIPLKKRRFFVLGSDWSDTEKDCLDYFGLTARISDAPRGIKYAPNPPPNEGNYGFDHFVLDLGAELPINTVEVLEAHETGSSEAVTYDAGLLITRTDGLRVALLRDPDSILGGLWLAHVPEDIDELRAGLRVRVQHGR